MAEKVKEKENALEMRKCLTSVMRVSYANFHATLAKSLAPLKTLPAAMIKCAFQDASGIAGRFPPTSCPRRGSSRIP
jgi:hypothetical protein